MNQIRVIPVLLLKNGGLYKTIQFKNPKYIGDPINAVKIFNEKEADEIVLLDYNASKDKRPIDFKKIAEIAGEAFMPMGYGGGIKTFDDAKKIFDGGFEKVILNSVLFENISLVEQIGNTYGSQAVVCSIDVKKNIFRKQKVYSFSGTKNTNYTAIDWAKKLEQNGAGEIFLNSIDKDGTWAGYDIELIKQISEAVNIPVIACGGAGSVADFETAIKNGKASAVAAGSMFVYQKKGMGVLISFPSQGLKM